VSVLTCRLFPGLEPQHNLIQMSQLLLGATVIVLILAGVLSLDIMGFAFWKGNQFPVEGKVSTLHPYQTYCC
jgi:hypothetical protein